MFLKGISYWSTKEGLAGTYPISSAIRDAADAGFDAIELCIGVEGVLTPQTSERECEQIRSEIEQSGLALKSLASGMSWGVNPVSDDPQVRAKSLANHNAALHIASWLGCETMLYVPGVVTSPISPGEHVRYDHAIERVGENIKQLAETAEQVGVAIGIENVWNGLFYSPVELAAFIDRIGSDYVGSYLDLGNLIGIHQHPPHWIELLGKRIKKAHIKGFEHQFDWNGSYRFMPGLDGDVSWQACIESLKAVGYDGTLTAEVMPWEEGLLERINGQLDAILSGSFQSTQ